MEKPKNVNEVNAQLAKLRSWLSQAVFLPQAVIEDYPIGGRERGMCRLSAEYKKGRGWRTVRETTNRHGRWCAPKYSTYREGPVAVVRHPSMRDRQAAWLSFSQAEVWLNYANGDTEALACGPCHGPPRRHEQRHTFTCTKLRLFGGEAPAKEESVVVLDANTPELCDAWDAWSQGLASVARDVAARLDAEAGV